MSHGFSDPKGIAITYDQHYMFVSKSHTKNKTQNNALGRKLGCNDLCVYF